MAYESVRMSPLDLSAARKQMTDIDASLQERLPALHTTSKAVETLVEDMMSLVMRDFVQAWHTPLLSGSPDTATLPAISEHSNKFPKLVELTIRASLSQVIERLAGIDLANVGVSKILPILTDHMKAFEAAEMQWKRSGSSAEILEEEESELFLAALYQDGRLHPALGTNASADTRLSELEHLRKVATRMVEKVLPHQEANSKGVFILVKEVVACTVIKSVIDVLSDPDTLNALLEEKASAALQEQKLVNQLREALDRQGSNLEPLGSASISLKSNKRRSRNGDTSFEHLLENINRSKSILEARRIKNSIMQQIRRSRAALADGPDIEVKRKSMITIYVQRLHAALDAVEHRMHQLGTSSADSVPTRATLSPSLTSEEASSMTLRDVLTSSSAIAHFLEFTEARKRSIFVQFWMSVNTFKYPLESAESDSEDDTHTSSPTLQMADGEQVKTLCEDLRFFIETYYQSSDLASVLGESYISSAKDFLLSYENDEHRASSRSVSVARRNVIRAQKRVYEEMLDVDWPAFEGTSAWHQAAHDLKREKDQEKPTMKSSSSLLLEKKSSPEQRSPRPSANRAMSHAHLFGLKEPFLDDGEESASLFGDDIDGSMPHQGLRAQSSYDKLLGSKGSIFDSTNGRMPLFQEALFEEDDQEVKLELDQDMTGKEALVHVNKIGAIEDVLASLIKEDLPSSDSVRPRLKKSRTSSRSTSKISLAANETQHNGFEERTAQKEQNVQPTSSHEETALLERPQSLEDFESKMERLKEQERMLDTLIRKAELTGSSTKEIRLLEKSKSTVARELRELTFEKTAVLAGNDEEQTVQQARIHLDPKRTRLQIGHSNISIDADGKEYATYLIEVSIYPKDIQGSGMDDKTAESGWIVSRRYNEFYLLHSRLKEKIVQIRALEHYFPGKRFAGQVSSSFIETRRISLQRYLQEIIRLESVCVNADFKLFLSQLVPVFSVDVLDRDRLQTPFRPSGSYPRSKSEKGLASRLYKGVTGVAGGLDDLLFGPSMYEIVVSRLSNSVVDLVGFNEMERFLAGATTSSPAQIKEATQALTASFTTPICDIVIELFQLKVDGNWFRRQAVIIVGQQALGGTIERKVRQLSQTALAPIALQGYITTIRNIMWPDGTLKQPGPIRSIEDKRRRSQAALKKLSTLIPTVASTFIGRDNARRAARRSWAILQNRKLNKHLIYTVLDKLVDEVFPSDEIAA